MIINIFVYFKLISIYNLPICRANSLEPFSRHFKGQKILDMIEINKQNEKCIVTGIHFFYIIRNHLIFEMIMI